MFWNAIGEMRDLRIIYRLNIIKRKLYTGCAQVADITENIIKSSIIADKMTACAKLMQP